MPKYLLKARYSTSGIAGVRKEGGSSRRQVVEDTIKSVGGSMESFYFAFGDVDAYVIVDAPSNVVAASVATAVSASGAVALETVPLLTCEEIDEAVKGSVDYRPPGT